MPVQPEFLPSWAAAAGAAKMRSETVPTNSAAIGLLCNPPELIGMGLEALIPFHV